jgi:glycosyltransferase involved in cell wall biosynthesis
MIEVSVIVPVYNGEKTIERLFAGINKHLESFKSFEVLLVYDQGTDKSWEILKSLREKYPDKIRIFKLKKNYGQHNAILFGISESKGDLIITMDEDLQHDPGYLRPLIDKQKEQNYSIVYGRFKDSKYTFFRKIASKILRILLKILIPSLGDYSSFRLLKKEVAKKITVLKNSYTFIDASLLTAVSDFGYLDIDHREYSKRESTYNLLKLASHAIQIILAYSGIIKWILIISISLIILACLSKLFNLAGFEMQIVMFIAGIFLLLTGISGELFHKWKVKTNPLPIIAVEDD